MVEYQQHQSRLIRAWEEANQRITEAHEAVSEWEFAKQSADPEQMRQAAARMRHLRQSIEDNMHAVEAESNESQVQQVKQTVHQLEQSIQSIEQALDETEQPSQIR
ncbi:hypothetical protein DUZ99_15095 [Xylanibacillus composti]|uniref:Uncharacterized protein n=1 Tax=Xylanibacillus composti TaxID=1572762 RepID=A0A8J4H485_9BACL|nr:hypothetical protein [Xylanibacillus composti]MDT9726307.1 hypothetical protein [Xylanibacillus composti]GIQ70663.1 hypothetical protein XYCOK13_34870 [Xylanibacillus composti]